MEKDDETYAPATGSMFSTGDCQVLDQLNLLRTTVSESPKSMDAEADHADSANNGNVIFDMFAMQFPCGSGTTQQDRFILTDALHFPDHSQRHNAAFAQIIPDNESAREHEHGFDPICFLKLPMLGDKSLDQKNLGSHQEALPLSLTSAVAEPESRLNEPRSKESTTQHTPCIDFCLSAPGCLTLHENMDMHVNYNVQDDGHVNTNTAREATASNISEKSLTDQQVGYSDAIQPAVLSQCSSGVQLQVYREKKKRSRACKNSDEVESQRMTHIAVERNRRKQMNEHLRVLRSLMPGSYVQRGDQASIIGGAIEFVKELEQLLQCLESQKRRRLYSESSRPVSQQNGSLVLQPPHLSYPLQNDVKYIDRYFEPFREDLAELKSQVADIEVKLVASDAMIKILSQRRPGQLLKTIAALENLNFTILHTNITTIEHTVLYSFNVKVSVECRSSTAEEIASSVHQIFNMIHSATIG
eukprot:c20530_g1_i1 orf=532-1947(-)